MRTQEQYISLGPHHKSILWPLISDWSELFEAVTTNEKEKPRAYTFDVGEKDRPCVIGPYMRTEYPDGTQTINGFTSTKYRMGPTVWVRLLPDLARKAFESTIGIPDHLSFQLIQWNDDEALIILQHSMIIGSRWLAVIDPRTIPKEATK